MRDLLTELVNRGGSDLHLTVGIPPQSRVSGVMTSIGEEILTSQKIEEMCYSVLTEEQKRKFEECNELDLSFGVKSLARFRGNVFKQKGAIAAVFRVIPHEILAFDRLGLPPVMRDLSNRPNGLILVTGPTGSGKSTTLASIVDVINETRRGHIITIEDPIEFVHNHKGCVVNQREVGSDTQSFKDAIRYILRQDPDVVLLGELRDLETIEAALTISETGHLCLATLHTNSCVQTINRIVDVFPDSQQSQIRAQLSFVLEGVLSQTLIPKKDGKGRAMAVEVMVPNTAIRAQIRDDKIHQIYSQMQMGQQKYGMQTMNQCLLNLTQTNQISREEALINSPDAEELTKMLGGGGGGSTSNSGWQ